jgi:glutaminyl-peptide cyclotransferase
MKIAFYLAGFLVLALSCNNDPSPSDDPITATPTKTISHSIVASYPHDTSSFTEGLLFYNGELFESTGLPGKSRISKVDLMTGKAIQTVELDKKYFGEGIVIINDTIYQWTYQDKIGLMYNAKDFKKIGEFKFASPEGWGMTTDGKQIIASDGTSNLSFYQPGSFQLLRTQGVTERGSLSYNLNELEYINGYIYANQWQSPYILKIDPASGEIVAKIDLSETCNKIKNRYPKAEFLNGIAYDPDTKKIYVTGKYWPELYEIQLGEM